MNRRDFIKTLTVGSIVLVLPVRAHASLLKPGNNVSLRCLGKIRGPNYPNYLDGRTRDGSVGLAPKLTPTFSGTKWKVFTAGSGAISLQLVVQNGKSLPLAVVQSPFSALELSTAPGGSMAEQPMGVSG